MRFTENMHRYFSNLFEVLYLCVMCVAPAVAFATGGATLSTLTGLPYLLCTLLIGVFIFVVAIFGTDLVRKVASVLSVCIIIGLLAVYVPNIIAGAGKIEETISVMTESPMPFGKALYAAFLYGTFQLANVAVFVQHAKSFEKPKDAVKSMVIGGDGKCDPDGDGRSRNHDRISGARDEPAECADIIHGAKWCGETFYDTADLCPDHPWCGVNGCQYGSCHGAEDMSWSGKENTADKTGTEKDGYKDADIGCTGMLCGGFWNCPVRTADIDSESVQHTGLPGNSGDTGSVYSTYGGYTDGYQE